MMNVPLDACMYRAFVYFSANGDVPQDHSTFRRESKTEFCREAMREGDEEG